MMKEKAKKLLEHKDKTLPILSFPVTSLLGITVEELISSSKTQALGMKTIAERCNMGAVLNMMDLSVEEEFSAPFLKEIIDAVSDDDFIFCYHNCGGAVADMADSIATLGADIYHFGNAINLADVIAKMPKDSIVMGNLNPLMLRDSTPEAIKADLERIFAEYSSYDNFMLSTGCDVPHTAKWENIDAYFEKVKELYA